MGNENSYNDSGNSFPYPSFPLSTPTPPTKPVNNPPGQIDVTAHCVNNLDIKNYK